MCWCTRETVLLWLPMLTYLTNAYTDFVAVGLGLTVVPGEDLATLHDVQATVGGVKAAVGAGTGLGEVFLIDSSLSSNAEAPAPVYVAYPCEGGMSEFLAHDEREWQLRQWLQREKKCGPGEFVSFRPLMLYWS